jgi:hypothetical protein
MVSQRLQIEVPEKMVRSASVSHQRNAQNARLRAAGVPHRLLFFWKSIQKWNIPHKWQHPEQAKT